MGNFDEEAVYYWHDNTQGVISLFCEYRPEHSGFPDEMHVISDSAS